MASIHSNHLVSLYEVVVVVTMVSMRMLHTLTDTTIESKPAKYSTIPNQLVRDFVGREEQLDQISSYFSSRDVDRPRILILHALGGQGKSQLALRYCQRKDYAGRFWINASSESTVTQSYVSIAEALDASAVALLND